MRSKQQLLLDQLDRKLQGFSKTETIEIPKGGWIKTIRTTFRMTLEQLGSRLLITKQGAKKIEEREANGSITLKVLKETAKALDMQLVYGFVPIGGSVDGLVYAQARRLAQKVVLRANLNMALENQATEEELSKAVDEAAVEIKRKMPRYLWN